MTHTVLVGDVGGTNVRFAIAQATDSKITLSKFMKFRGDDFTSFDDALAAYVHAVGAKVLHACFALAGPPKNGEVTLTNRNWTVSIAQLKARFGISSVALINDFAAMARAVPECSPEDFEDVVPGEPIEGEPQLVAGPGTGFGVATLLKDGYGSWQVLNGEGGHMAYPPRTELEFELARILIRDHGYVSNELVAAGIGLEKVHRAFCEIYGRAFETAAPEEMQERAEAGDEMYAKLLEVRALAVMGAVGDLALANGTRGGVTLAGGVSQKLVTYLKAPAAVERFHNRGGMSSYLENCPVSLLINAEAPLIGAAACFVEEACQ